MSTTCHAENEPLIRSLERELLATPILGLLLRRCTAAITRTAGPARLFLVGGYPRDRAVEQVHGLVRPRGDLDLLVTGLDARAWEDLAGGLERELDGTGIVVKPDIGRAFPVIKLARRGLSVDLAPARRRGGDGDTADVSLAEDLARRDFTINALAVAVVPDGERHFGALLDPHDGLGDVRRGRIGPVGTAAECLDDDPLRMYRAVRLETELWRAGFALDEALARETRTTASTRVSGVARERVVAEVERALRADAGRALCRLEELDLLAPVGLPGAAETGGQRARHQAAAMLDRFQGEEVPRSVLWGVLLAAAGITGRDAVRQLRLPRRTAHVASRLLELQAAARQAVPDPGWLDRALRHRLTGPEAAAITRLLGAAPLDPDGHLARAYEAIQDHTLAALLEDARRAAGAMAGGMPRGLALPALRRSLLRHVRTTPARWVTAWTDAGLLAALLPEIEAMRGVPQPPEFHAEGDVLRHTVLALEALAEHYPDAGDVLVLAVLLHDAGKPGTLRTPAETGDRIRFHGHDQAGAELAANVALDLGLSEAQAADVHWLVAHHIAFFGSLESMRLHRAARVFGHRRFLELLRLHHCDCLSSLRPTGGGDFASLRRAVLRYGDHLAEQARQLQDHAGRDRLRAAGIDGWTLRERLTLTEGPAVGRCLAALRAALDADPDLDDEQLWALARGFANEPEIETESESEPEPESETESEPEPEPESEPEPEPESSTNPSDSD